MTHLEMVDPLTVNPGETIRPIPSKPASDGVVAWVETDEHYDETYHLTDGRTVWHRYGIPIAVVRHDDQEFHKGDQVEITLRGEVVHTYGGTMTVNVPGHGNRSIWIGGGALASPAVTVVRQAPAETVAPLRAGLVKPGDVIRLDPCGPNRIVHRAELFAGDSERVKFALDEDFWNADMPCREQVWFVVRRLQGGEPR